MKYITLLIAVVTVLLPAATNAELYLLHDRDDTVIGTVRSTASTHNDTLLDIARTFGLGYNEIKLSNPELDTWMPGNKTEVILPTEFVLPAGEREGIILNIPEMRLYYFPKPVREDVTEVITFPLGIGREGRSTPYIKTRVIEKKKHPTWYPPESIRKEHAAEGDPLPRLVRPGPENPLGDYAMRLGQPQYLIHGTNKPWGIGMRVSSGCIRLYPENIEELYGLVGVGTRVNIVNQPYKVGRRGDRLYLEAHPFLGEDSGDFDGNLTSVVKAVIEITGDRPYEVDWDLARRTIRERNGMPVEIGVFRDAPGPIMAGKQSPGASDPAGVKLRMETSLGAQ